MTRADAVPQCVPQYKTEYSNAMDRIVRKRYSLYRSLAYFSWVISYGQNKTFFRENVTPVDYNRDSRTHGNKEASTQQRQRCGRGPLICREARCKAHHHP